MSTGIDIQFVRENYQKKTDAELIQAATTDAIGLTAEAMEVVKEEIIRRKLDPSIIRALEAQNKTYTLEEIDSYCNLIRQLHCPICGSSVYPLNATMTSEVISFVIFTQWNKKLKIACPHCLDKANESALTKTALPGFWGIPWGIIRSVQAIGQNMKSKKTNHTDTANDFLRSYVLSRIGELESCKDSKQQLQQIIAAG